MKKGTLGRGLDALISMDEIKIEGSSSINEIPLTQISANPDQPRRLFDQETLAELAASIREIGVIQPITLREITPNNYQIIAGERRYRASQLCELTSIPAYIRTAKDESVMEMALIENIQREDLNAVEIALAFQNLLEQYDLTQERLSERVGKKRATIANYLRLLKLPAEIQIGLKNKTIDMGHARALLAVENTSMQLKVYELILQHGYSVRKVEELVKELNNQQEANSNEKPKKEKVDSDYKFLEKHLSDFFHTNVLFNRSTKGSGKISISFKNDDELEKIISLLDMLSTSNK